jgi:hypothetical protein
MVGQKSKEVGGLESGPGTKTECSSSSLRHPDFNHAEA